MTPDSPITPTITNASHGFVSAHTLLSQDNPYNCRFLSGLNKSLTAEIENDAEASHKRTSNASGQDWEPSGDRSGPKKAAGRSRKQIKNLDMGTSSVPAAVDGTGNPKNANTSKNPKRSKKLRKDDQPTIKSTKITKPGTDTSSTKRKKQSSAKTLPQEFDVVGEDRVGTESKIQPLGEPYEQPLGLTEAVQRRNNWTPVKDSEKERPPVDDIEAAWSLLIPGSPSTPSKPSQAAPESRVEKYLYEGSKSESIMKSPVGENCSDRRTAKKRKLDLVPGITLTKPKGAPAKRSKSPKKKPQTITDKSTAQFARENPSTTSTLRDYFAGNAENETSISTLVVQPAILEEEAKVVQSEKSSKTRGPKAKPKSKVKAPVNLLSPQCAMKKANEQDLLFGTSSQLAREESPSFIRDLQRAFKESETVDSTEEASQAKNSQVNSRSFTASTSTSQSYAASRNLWSVAARDSLGSLLDIDRVDLANTPNTTRLLSAKIDRTHAGDEAKPPQTASIDPADECCKPAADITAPEAPTALTASLGDVETLLPRSLAEASLRQRPKSRSPVKKQQESVDKQCLGDAKSNGQRPNVKGCTDVDLRKALAAFGFKNIRGRERMISLLEECWDSIDKRALKTLSSNVPVSSSVAARGPSEGALSPKKSTKKRGRPPKNLAGASEMKDPDAASTSSPKKPKGRPRKSLDGQPSRTNAQIALPASGQPKNVRSTTAVMTAQQIETLFVTIAKAIKTYPTTHDSKNLTWYEKILLYDPIVLEDLAQWLNQTGLPGVGYDNEVSPSMVKSWCESQSVCCMWKENLRGGTRARY
ncbi:MAG: hypothetical protein Q9220_002536 [cf. Caloplaca sp. 1 TL-2023]